MAKVASSRGGFVNVNITGIGEVIKRLRQTGKQIENNVELAIVKVGAFIEDEVKESISGRRAEPKSVDTGRLANSIQANNDGPLTMVIAPKRIRYPNSKITTKEVAKFMEFGTTSISPRRHFRNTEARNKKKIIKLIDVAVKKDIK